jgi:asparagine synthase (glutamine-hydrolysing)
MCGIAGIINFNSSEDKQGLLRRMIGLLRHRGPDSTGIYLGGPAGLAHARLSIIDLSSGDQPIHNEDRSIWIVFNGEIFNYPELRADLKSRGHRFYTQTDTEVLVHLYEEKGPKLFDDLNGQFALALWNENLKTLLLGRDRMGIRPLFYHHANGRLVFGSEIKALFGDDRIPRSLDGDSLSNIFTCWSSLGSGTPFEDIFQIPSGHFGLFSRQGLEVQPYWKLPIDESDQRLDRQDDSLPEWTAEFNDLILDATRIRLRADVPVGAYLSGGIDSTFTSALVKRNFNNFLCTFSVQFTDERFDETRYQQTAIEALNTDHRSIRCSEENIGEIFPKVIWHTETPILRTAPVPLYRLSRLVRDNRFKVVLTGEGADEIFAGYNIFKEDRVRRFWARNPDSRLRPALLKKLYPYIFSHQNEKAQAFLIGFFKRGLSQVDSPVYSHLLRWQNTAQLANFFSADIKKKGQGVDRFVDRYLSSLPSNFMSWHPLSRAQYTEINIFLSNYLLSSQGDRMAMGNSVEGRYPFLDHRVVEFAFRVPPRFRLNGLQEKFILKQAAKNIIPRELIDRPKQPYRAPISRCFWGDRPFEYVEDLLSETAIRQAGYFDPVKVSRLAAKCRQQKGDLLSERENMALVGILSTQLVDHLFIKNFPAYPIQEPEDVKVFGIGQKNN